MKVLVDGQEILNLSDIDKQIIADDVNVDILDRDIKRRLAWVIKHKISRNMDKIKRVWIPKLRQRGIESIPLDDALLAALIFEQPDYQDAKARAQELEPRL